MESCVLCGQTISAKKGIKQHFNRQHPEIMEALATILPPRLQQFKVFFHQGDTCRYCRHRIDAPGRHSQQCSPLLQAHVLHEVVNRGLSTQPRHAAALCGAPGSTFGGGGRSAASASTVTVCEVMEAEPAPDDPQNLLGPIGEPTSFKPITCLRRHLPGPLRRWQHRARLWAWRIR